jgi:hypothetical protein
MKVVSTFLGPSFIRIRQPFVENTGKDKETKEVYMTTATVNEVMQQRLTRGTPVLIADSFGRAKMRGAKMIVASKSTVKCNQGGRCAGNWCIEAAVFVTEPACVSEDKQMAWRRNTVKICLTHLKTDQGALILPPPVLEVPSELKGPLSTLAASANGRRGSHVTWEELAEAHRSGNLDRLAHLARRLKADTESLVRKVVEAQDRLIEALTE